MKWLIGIVLAVFLGTVAVTTVVGVTADDEVTTAFTAPRPTVTTARPGTTPGSVTPVAPPSSTSVPSGPRTFTLAEIARHASPSDCWLLISGAVYDVTSYLGRHPGGAGLVTPWCGKESTEAFATEDGRGEHSSRAYSLLAGYYIGDLR